VHQQANQHLVDISKRTVKGFVEIEDDEIKLDASDGTDSD